MKKRNNFVETYLVRNKEDLIFKKAIEIEENCDKTLQKEVNRIYRNSYSEFKQLLGEMDKYYKKGFTLKDYYFNILTVWGNGNRSRGEEKFIKLMDKVAEDITNKITIYADVGVREVKDIIIVQTLFKPYIGFLFEEYIEELLESEGIFNVEQSKDLDKTYKIDLLVSVKGLEQYKIGLQLKSYTFDTIYIKTKQKYLREQQRAIEEGICRDVFYLLHNDNAEILKAKKILHSKSICNDESVRIFGEDFTVAEEEEFINELIKVVFELYNIDNKKEENNSFLSFLKEFRKEEKEQKFIEFKEKLYKMEKSLLSTPIDVSHQIL